MLTDQGDIAIQRVVRMVEAEVREGLVAPEAVVDRIRLGLKYVAYQADGKGHPEVYKVAVQEAVEDEVNRLLLRQGLARISRWDW
jgi:hypothetical protein